MTHPDIYFKKRIPYTCRGAQFQFDVAHTLFSTFEVDDGTDLLLRTLDLGCGCGVLGIVLGNRYPEARIVMADKDLLAVRYARHNLVLNGTAHAEVIGSVGLSDVPDGPYDLIVSNIPAKIGDEAIEQEFVLGPLARLRPGGEYWFVVVSGLNHLIPKIGVRHQLRMKEMKKRSGHAVYRVLKSAEL
jgi:16S rRNA (guanine1207-N2)-methyltransferase